MKVRISDFQGNMKESWKAINELANERSKSSNIDSLKESGSETVHKKDISNKMNSFFCSVGKDFADKIDPTQIPFLQVTMKLTNIKLDSTLGSLKCSLYSIVYIFPHTRSKGISPKN